MDRNASRTRTTRRMLIAGLIVVAVVAMSSAFAQTLAPGERVAALKASIQKDQAAFRQYQWIETTIMSIKGEEKSRKQNQCSYGADGKLVKVPGGEQPEE